MEHDRLALKTRWNATRTRTPTRLTSTAIKEEQSCSGEMCNCTNCARGELTKTQYVDEIRALCGQVTSTRSSNSGRKAAIAAARKTSSRQHDGLMTTNRKLSASTPSLYESKLPGGKTRNDRTLTRSLGNSEDRSLWNRDFVNHIKWAEGIARETTIGNARRNDSCRGNDVVYYVDEEQPSDLEGFSDMVNGMSADPRILPAVVQTIEYLRKGYHRMLLGMKPKSRDFFDREYAKMERNRFYVAMMERIERGNRNSSPATDDGNDSGTGDWSHGRLCVSRESISSQRSGDRIYNDDSDWTHRSRSDSGVTVMSNGSVFKQAINNNNNALLRLAAISGNTDQVMHLTLQGCDLNQPGHDGWPAVDAALGNSRFKCAIFLIEAGTNMAEYTTRKMAEYTEIIYRARQYLYVVKTCL